MAGANKKFTLVIDPGHGGKDAGAPGTFSVEKNINLNVALAFGRYVEQNCPDVRVVYTRKTDVFIPLYERANIANIFFRIDFPVDQDDRNSCIVCLLNHRRNSFGFIRGNNQQIDFSFNQRFYILNLMGIIIMSLINLHIYPRIKQSFPKNLFVHLGTPIIFTTL